MTHLFIPLIIAIAFVSAGCASTIRKWTYEPLSSDSVVTVRRTVNDDSIRLYYLVERNGKTNLSWLALPATWEKMPLEFYTTDDDFLVHPLAMATNNNWISTDEPVPTTGDNLLLMNPITSVPRSRVLYVLSYDNTRRVTSPDEGTPSYAVWSPDSSDYVLTPTVNSDGIRGSTIQRVHRIYGYHPVLKRWVWLQTVSSPPAFLSRRRELTGKILYPVGLFLDGTGIFLTIVVLPHVL
jgi:hypothetical protein